MNTEDNIAALHQIAMPSEIYACRNADGEWIASHIDRVLNARLYA